MVCFGELRGGMRLSAMVALSSATGNRYARTSGGRISGWPTGALGSIYLVHGLNIATSDTASRVRTKLSGYTNIQRLGFGQKVSWARVSRVRRVDIQRAFRKARSPQAKSVKSLSK